MIIISCQTTTTTGRRGQVQVKKIEPSLPPASLPTIARDESTWPRWRAIICHWGLQRPQATEPEVCQLSEDPHPWRYPLTNPIHGTALPNPCPPLHGGHTWLFLEVGWEPDPLTAALALPGWAKRKSQVLEGEIPGLTSPSHSDWQLPPTPAHVPVLTHPQGCQGLKEVALSETIIRDFIIYFSSLRTNSSLQHVNLLFKFQTPKWPSNTLLGIH